MSPVRIERVAKNVETRERHLALVSSHVTSELERRMSEMEADTRVPAAAAQPLDGLAEFGGLRTRDQLESHLLERLSLDVFAPATTFKLTVQSGTKVFGPPYDQDWSEGSGFGNSARFSGRALTINKDDGFSAAGVGFYLTTTETVLAAIRPQGNYDWNWAAFGDLPSARSRGGMGLTIYTDGQQQPTLSHQPVLWSVSGVTTLAGDKGSGQIAAAASPAFGLGTIPLAPALLQMSPGSTYLVWVWTWQIAQGTDGPFIAFSKFDMPLVTIDAGPPIALR
ncbi:MAG TPA: hypothetical protein VJV79_08940 [Polyangiaceae bacterium]|nr:hypothetical protein [Polyangiaceae bacterium]